MSGQSSKPENDALDLIAADVGASGTAPSTPDGPTLEEYEKFRSEEQAQGLKITHPLTSESTPVTSAVQTASAAVQTETKERQAKDRIDYDDGPAVVGPVTSVEPQAKYRLDDDSGPAPVGPITPVEPLRASDTKGDKDPKEEAVETQDVATQTAGGSGGSTDCAQTAGSGCKWWHQWKWVIGGVACAAVVAGAVAWAVWPTKSASPPAVKPPLRPSMR